MSKNKTPSWNTKYGRRRVREEAPTMEEAIQAAQGMTDDVAAHAEIAASLLGIPVEQVQTALAKMATPRKEPARTFAFTGPASAPRTVVVERKPSRRVAVASNRGARPAWASVHSSAMASPR